jgi:hypothetical protein
MSIKWADFKTRLLNGILATVDAQAATTQPPDDVLKTWCRWGLAELSAHTAEATSQLFNGNGEQTSWTITDDIVDRLQDTGMIIMGDENSTYNIIPPRAWNQDTIIDANSYVKEFWEYPAGTINFSFAPKTQFAVWYYRVWQMPETDDDLLMIPRWMERPLAMNIVAQYCEPYALEFSKVRQWNRRSDSGNPEDNTMFQQIAHLRKISEEILRTYPPQSRQRFYNNLERSVSGR